MSSTNWSYYDYYCNTTTNISTKVVYSFVPYRYWSTQTLHAKGRQITTPQTQHLDPLSPSQEPVFHGLHMLDVVIHRLRSKDKWVPITHSPGLKWKETKILMYRLLTMGTYSKILHLFSIVRHASSSEINVYSTYTLHFTGTYTLKNRVYYLLGCDHMAPSEGIFFRFVGEI